MRKKRYILMMCLFVLFFGEEYVEYFKPREIFLNVDSDIKIISTKEYRNESAIYEPNRRAKVGVDIRKDESLNKMENFNDYFMVAIVPAPLYILILMDISQSI